MSLFGKKKEEKSAPTCACSGKAVKTEAESRESRGNGNCCGEKAAEICCMKVLGAGCKSCHELFENAQKAVNDMGLSVEVEYVTDMEKIVSYGVMSTPALVVNEKVVSMGKALKAADVEKLLYKLGFQSKQRPGQ